MGWDDLRRAIRACILLNCSMLLCQVTTDKDKLKNEKDRATQILPIIARDVVVGAVLDDSRWF